MSKITIRVKRKLRTGNIYLIRCKGEPLYVGKTIQMKGRWCRHQNDKSRPMRKHMAEFGLTEFDYNLEILETMQVVDQHDKKLCAAEGKHFHCFTEQGYQLLNEHVPNNGVYVKGSIAYANHQARNKQKLPCKLCGAMVRRDGIPEHKTTDICKYLQMYQYIQNLQGM